MRISAPIRSAARARRRLPRWARRPPRNTGRGCFDGTTVTIGDKIELHGEGRNGGFVITTPSGPAAAPASVHPSNPWSPAGLKADVMMSTRTGRIMLVAVTGGEERTTTLAGHQMRLRQYEVVGEKHQFVWFDASGHPVAFRTEQEGSNIDFVLVRAHDRRSRRGGAPRERL